VKDYKIIISIFIFIAGALTVHLYHKANYAPYKKVSSSRFIAQINENQQGVINDITKKVVAIKSRQDLLSTYAFIMEQGKSYPDFPAVQMFYHMVKPLPYLEGIIWRLRGLVEKTDITHLSTLYYLRRFYHNRYVYGPHIKTLFHYLTEAPQDPKKTMFHTVSELQAALMEISPVFEKHVLNELIKLKSSIKDPEAIQFKIDKALWIGKDDKIRFLDPYENEKYFIKPYLNYIISGLSRIVGGAKYASCYNFDDVPNIMRTILIKSAINSLESKMRQIVTIQSLPNILTRKEIYGTLIKYPHFLKARYPEEQTNKILAQSFNHFMIAAQNDLEGYGCSIAYPYAIENNSNEYMENNCKRFHDENRNQILSGNYFTATGNDYLLDPNQLLIDLKQKLHELRERYKLYAESRKGEDVTIVSDATGEPITLNVRKAFMYHKTLQKFFPVTFEENINETYPIQGVGQKVSIPGRDKAEWLWNYAYGRPKSWDDPTHGGFLPEATDENMYDQMRNIILTNSTRPFSQFFLTTP